MKKIALLSIVALFIFACGQQNKGQKNKEEVKQETVVYTVDDLLNNAAELTNNEIVIKGTVLHVCQHGGGRCYLMGSTEDYSIRIEAGEKIGAFSQEQMGSDLEITGILREVKTEADAHNPAKEHGTEAEHEEDKETKNAHKLIAENEEAAETVYFIEGLTVKEL